MALGDTPTGGPTTGFAFKENTTIDSDFMTDTMVALEEPKGDEAVHKENLKYSALVSHIMSRFNQAKQARRTDEIRWLEAYRNYRGLYGPDVQFTSSEKSRAFIKITKTKVNAAYAQISEILFAGNRFPIGVESTPVPTGIEAAVHFDPQDPANNPQGGTSPAGGPSAPPGNSTVSRPGILESLGSLKKVLDPIKEKLKSGVGTTPTALTWEPAKIAAKKMDKMLQDQLAESNADKALRAFCFEQSLFGTGCFKGPILVDKEYPKWDESGKYTPQKQSVAQVMSVSIWDAYPDPDARSMEEAADFTQRHRMSKSQLRALKRRPHFRAKSIDEAIEDGADYFDEYWESTLRDDRQEGPNERWEVLEYWGLADSDLEDIADLEIPDEYKNLDEVQINAWVCNGHLLRLVFNPFTPARIPYYVCPYEINPYSIFGIGVAENMSDTQLLMNGFMRMAVDNGVLSSNIIFEVNDNNLVPGQDFEIYPGKIFRTNGQVGQSIFATKFPNVTQECMLLFDKARQLADEATGMPSYSHGQAGITGVGRTASGMSMLMGAAKENIKSVVRNIDDYLLVPLGKALFAFNMQFNFDKEFIGDLEIKAEGTSSLMRNEVRSQKLLQFMQLTNNPADLPWIKRDYILRELAESLDMEADLVVNDPREAGVQAEQIKAMNLAQGIQPQQPPQGAAPGEQAGGGNPSAAPAASDPTQSGGGNIGPGAAPPPGAAGFSGTGGGQGGPI